MCPGAHVLKGEWITGNPCTDNMKSLMEATDEIVDRFGYPSRTAHYLKVRVNY